MTKRERARLRGEMSKIIAANVAEGNRLTTSQVCEMMIESFPHLVDDAAERLIRQSLQNMARELFKEAGRSDGEDIQVSLFGNEVQDLRIQKCIAIPAKDGSKEMVWVSTLKATRAEIKAYVRYLRGSAEADMEKAKKLAHFEDMIGQIAISDDLDTPIEELLQGLQARAV